MSYQNNRTLVLLASIIASAAISAPLNAHADECDYGYGYGCEENSPPENQVLPEPELTLEKCEYGYGYRCNEDKPVPSPTPNSVLPPSENHAPYCEGPTGVITIKAGEPYKASCYCNDEEMNDVKVTPVILPPGINHLDSNWGEIPLEGRLVWTPVTAGFDWTPTTEDCGEHQVLITAMQRFELLTAECKFVINVECPNIPAVCDAGPPHRELPCDGPTKTIQLDGTGSYDPDGGGIKAQRWYTNCPGASFDDEFSQTPQLTFNSYNEGGSPVECDAEMILSDGYNRSRCGTRISVQQCSFDCAGTLNGSAIFDKCGVCGGDNSTCAGCDGIPNSGLVYDECGVCDGDNSTCSDCAGTPNGSATFDSCGVCNGDNSTCSDCLGVPNGTAQVDECGICAGDGSQCRCTVNDLSAYGITLDGNALDGRSFVKYLGSLYKKVYANSKKKLNSKKLQQQAQAIYLNNWHISATYPTKDYSCGPLVQCVSVNAVTNIPEYEAGMNELLKIGTKYRKEILKKPGLTKQQHKKLDQIYRRLTSVVKKSTPQIVQSLPASVNSCEPEQNSN